MRISESVVIVFFLPMFCSFIDLPQLQCVLSNEQFQINDTLFKKVEEREMNLARELCAQGSLSSFCDDGNDQPYRSYPAFVHLNFENFMCSYDSIVYLFATPSICDSLEKMRQNFRFPWELDDLFIGTNFIDNTVSFETPNSYKHKINRYQRKIKSKKVFDGTFSYALYRMKFECVYEGNINLIIPDTESKGFSIRICKVYYITNIQKIRPITKEQYLEL